MCVNIIILNYTVPDVFNHVVLFSLEEDVAESISESEISDLNATLVLLGVLVFLVVAWLLITPFCF